LDDPDDVVAATRLNLGIEECVRHCPEQYTWSYRRFRTRPPEELAAVRRGEPPRVPYRS
jgi:KDO2-lipid IV(A) lauroyltransferase